MLFSLPTHPSLILGSWSLKSPYFFSPRLCIIHSFASFSLARSTGTTHHLFISTHCSSSTSCDGTGILGRGSFRVTAYVHGFSSKGVAAVRGVLRKRATANSFTWACCCSWSSKGHTSSTVWQKKKKKKQERVPSTTSDRQTARVKRKRYVNQMTWREGANLKAHITSRTFPRETPLHGNFFPIAF